jgi:hypothetical protein
MVDPDRDFRSKFTTETAARIERLAKLTGRTSPGVVEAALGLWEQALLTSTPVARRSGYMACRLEYAVVITQQPPRPTERPMKHDNGYAGFLRQQKAMQPPGNWLALYQQRPTRPE